MKDLERQLLTVRAHWDRKAHNDSIDAVKVDATPRAQAMRFEAFLYQHNVCGRSILDVGCGVGDFWNHLVRRNLDVRYLGVDLSERMIECARKKFPGASFACMNILETDPGAFDYTVSFGIHHLRLDGAEALLKAVTRRQFELCRRAAHVSLLTNRFSGFGPDALCWKPEEILALCLEITPYVVLRHDYLPNDFSVALYRQPLIDTAPDLLLPPR